MKLIIIIPLLFLLCSCTSREFNSKEWKSWRSNSISDSKRRWNMSNDLIENQILLGKSPKEVIVLLGESENSQNRLKNKWYYNLGPCGRGIDYGSLYIIFENEIVKSVEKYCN